MPQPIGAPKDWTPETHGNCAALFVRLDDDNGLRFMRSAWEPTARDVGMMLAGSPVNLGICAPLHPVVQVDVPEPEGAVDPVMTMRPVVGPRGERAVRLDMFFTGVHLYVEVDQPEGCSVFEAVKTGVERMQQLADQNSVTP